MVSTPCIYYPLQREDVNLKLKNFPKFFTMMKHALRVKYLHTRIDIKRITKVLAICCLAGALNVKIYFTRNLWIDLTS
uniref:Uncharacterized protein n=1 Tax=Wuchereria bancrofti TaxID=6293 RepID=A0AAF5RXV4_WUCBA